MLRNDKIVQRFASTVRTRLSTINASRFYGIVTSSSHPGLDPSQEREMKEHKLILVDENDRVVGSETKLNCHLVRHGKLLLHRAFSVLMFNSKKELVLTKRAPTKAFAPNYVTNACCSHPLYDASVHHQDAIQSTRSAAVARCIFELGIPRTDISAADLAFVGRILYKTVDIDAVWGEHELCYIFVLQKDVHMTPHPEEVGKIWSVPREEFIDFIGNLQYPLTPWFKIYINDWLFRIWDNLHSLERISDQKKIHKYTLD